MEQTTTPPNPTNSLKTMTQVVYGCYLASLLIGITSIVGIIIAYIKQGEAQGTPYASHFQWQIRTFWFTLLFSIIGVVLSIVGIGFLILLAVLVWFIYRSIKGLLRANEGLPIENPKAWM